MEKRSRIRYNKHYRDAPYHWREQWFEQPERKETRDEKKRQKRRDELNKTISEFKEKWLTEPTLENLGTLLNYTAYASAVNATLGNERTLFILQQIDGLPELPSLRAELLNENFAVALSNLNLANQSDHFMNLAIENGYTPEYQSRKHVLIALTTEAWRVLKGDIIKSWPK
jgi:hypothetical protein